MGGSTGQETTKAVEALNNTINPTGICRPLNLVTAEFIFF